jgi:PAS domain S-box-containing protein
LTRKGIILVVDDTPESLLMLVNILNAEGYQVRPADSGELALASVAAAKPELILLDIRMPGMDGFEVCRRLKAVKETRDIPVMFLSAVPDSEERVEGLKLGAVDFVSKPFFKEELLARIDTHLELSRLRGRLALRVAQRTAKLKAANEQLEVELAERIQIEQALRESEKRFRTVADTAPVIIWTSGPDTKVDFVNRFGLSFTGRKLESLIGDGWKESIHPADQELKYPGHIPQLDAGHDYRVEYRLCRADGEYRWMLDTAKPRFFPNGDFAGYIGVVTDITDVKRNQERLFATQKLESLGVLAAGIAHNLNNQMGTILAEADLALLGVPRETAAHTSVEHISSVAMKVSGTVALLMSYAGSGSTSSVPLNISHIVDEALLLLRATTPKNVVFSVDLSNRVPAVNADLSQMRQVILNLVTNASEAIGNQQGTIKVTTSSLSLNGSQGNAGEPVLRPGDYVSLEVSDTGCGIAEADLARIFDPFYSTKSLGRGLGLPAVQGIVRSLGGAIRVKSTAGEGSRFEVLLPAYVISNHRVSAAK